MNAETVFKFYRAYKLFYQGSYDFKKYGGNIRTPPLINQPDRRFYHRIAQKLNDDQVHALFTHEFFFKPNAYVADLATPEAFTNAITFAARAENGRILLENELYALKKTLADVDLDAWLYGEIVGGQRTVTPECLSMVVTHEINIDVACLLLLIPQPQLSYNWPVERAKQSHSFGNNWLDSLKRADQLLYRQRPLWRTTTQALAKEFWASLGCASLSPKPLSKTVDSSLF